MDATPHARTGMAIGLLGGSFDPAHDGHVHATREALKRFRLDRVWWLVSPGNPLKRDGPAPLERRVARARALLGGHPRVSVTDIEARLGTRHTAATLTGLRRLYPGVRFVWLMGADNLAQFHRWDRWRRILRTVPVGVVARPGDRMAARMSPAAHAFRRWQVPEAGAPGLAGMDPPAWCLVNVPMHPASSTAIRAAGGWVTRGGLV
ncbi:nicotinate-nucleotide adenylyltransferase [Jannaschia sp. LMIT008]|uniref:nicotinate-nucleotide adenylyltransferase n=1 Tax=Jannaschia maritima TaxID=3032585 RepID=UPI0028119492|nr:nicotinate-nucleotide adenylyltransferase [Jannaschia sp. LMIT008]